MPTSLPCGVCKLTVIAASARTASEALSASGTQTTTRRPSRSARMTATTRPSPMQVRSLDSCRVLQLRGLRPALVCCCSAAFCVSTRRTCACQTTPAEVPRGCGAECEVKLLLYRPISCEAGSRRIHGAAAGGTDQERWDFWGRFMQPLIATRPHQAVAGNHEIETVRASFSSTIRPTHLCRRGGFRSCLRFHCVRQHGTITRAVAADCLVRSLKILPCSACIAMC